MGAMGPTGPAGPTGANGATGATGTSGATGNSGNVGANRHGCHRCSRSDRSDWCGSGRSHRCAGATGSTGATGPTGPAGATGAAGTTVTYRAGEATLASGHNTIAVTLSSAMPSIDYAINVTQEGVVNWGTTPLFGSTTVPNQPIFAVVARRQPASPSRSQTVQEPPSMLPQVVTLDWSALNDN